jgi:hypothetical protein
MEVPVTVFLTRRQLGERWHVAPGTLANWATQKEGPESRVIAGRVLYRLEDVEAWEAEQWGDGDQAERIEVGDAARRPGRKPA